MRTRMLSPYLSILLLPSLLLAAGCAKKQVVTDGTDSAAAASSGRSGEPNPAAPRSGADPTARSLPAPGTDGSAPAAKEERRTPPPPGTAALEPAPSRVAPGAGLPGAKLPLQRIHFDFDRASLTPTAQQTLASAAAYLKSNQAARIRIEGHCDEQGTTEYNLALGERRAKAAYQYLMDLGIDPNRMATVSYGEEMPLDPRRVEEAWAKNRRAELLESAR